MGFHCKAGNMSKEQKVHDYWATIHKVNFSNDLRDFLPAMCSCDVP